MEDVEKLRTELKIRGFSPLTARNYSFFVEKFLLKANKKAGELTEDDAKAYLAGIFDSKSKNTVMLAAASLKFFFKEILKKEFGKSLSDEGVHIIDPFVGTGNFITRIMREIKKTSLPQKYANELHCNEVMLLPYYVASMNIEHEYYERTGEY